MTNGMGQLYQGTFGSDTQSVHVQLTSYRQIKQISPVRDCL
jgi:hypothetical protein